MADSRRAYRQLAALDAPFTGTPALRWACAAMLHDPAYPEAEKNRPWVEARLQEAYLTERMAESLTILALRWARQQGGGVETQLRQALGDTTTGAPETAQRTEGASDEQSSADRITSMATVPDFATNGTEYSTEVSSMDAVYGLDAKALQALATQREYMNCAPYNTPVKKFADAFKCVEQGRVTTSLDADDVWVVQGSGTNVYQVDRDGCSCPNGQKQTKTKYGCYHAVAVELYRRWQRAMQPSMVPPPKTVEERMAETPLDPAQEPQDIPGDTQDPEDDIPDVAAPAPVLEAPRAPQEPLVTTEPPTQALSLVPHVAPMATTLDARSLEASLEEWGKQRAVITRYIKQHFVEGTDFYTLKIGGRQTKPSLGKSGAEKFLSLFQLLASFDKDDATWEMLGRPVGVICYVCRLHTRSGEVIGEGRGCRDVKKDQGDVNKAIKMAQKSGLVDAILRTGALSEAFTQDLQDMEEEPARPAEAAKAPPASPAKPPSNVQYQRLGQEITALLRAQGFIGSGLEATAEEVVHRTGLALIRDNYEAILAKLQETAAA